jgi:hypothetical protein
VALSFEFFCLLDINPKMTPFQRNYRRERKKKTFPAFIARQPPATALISKSTLTPPS